MAKRKKSVLPALLKIVAALIVLLFAAYYISARLFKPEYIRYTAFGIDMPTAYSVHGIDVSRYQKAIDWEGVKNMRVEQISMRFAFMKATEGISIVDPKFRRNWFNAAEAGMIRGAYHFFNTTKSAEAQARNFLQVVKLQKGDMPPVLDVEVSHGMSKESIQTGVANWLARVENAYGVRPIIYTNVSFYNTYLAGRFDDYPLWVAHYFAKGKPRIEREWLFWQHSERGHVNGIEQFVDFNVFNGDSADLAAITIQ